MAAENHCSKCGTQLSSSTPYDLCPKCLIKIGFQDEVNATLDATPIEGPGTKIGRYDLLEKIGEGGMGLVYLAQQKEPVKRRLALKIIKPGMDSKDVIARFEAERQTLALLDHPNIAHVFDAGTTDTGRPYFVMEYVKGMTITRYCDEHKLNIEQRLRLFKDVCEGVHHAHQKGIIHRDIKPSNILISMHGDRAVPKIIDFGIAKAAISNLTEKTMFTFQGQLLGTPEYMSPEQVDLATQDIDTRSDIYSLGVVLYELLTGVLPFEKASLQKIGLAELQRTLKEVEPVSPSIRLAKLGEDAKAIAKSRMTQVVPLARCLHRELEWIPLKAMRKDRCRRYKSASDMADDIQNYLNGNPLLAGPETVAYRAKKFVNKHAGFVTTVALVSLAIIIGLVVSITFGQRAEQARQQEAAARIEAEQARDKEIALRKQLEQALERARNAEKIAQEQRKLAEEQAEVNRRTLYFNRIAHAKTISEFGSPTAVRDILKSCNEDLRAWEWYHLWHNLDRDVLSTKGHKGQIFDVAWSPCGLYFATAGGNDKTARLWDAETAKELLNFHEFEGYISEVSFSKDGHLLAVAGGKDKLINIYEIPSGKEIHRLQGHGKGVGSVAFAPTGTELVSGGVNGVIKIWDASTGISKVTLKGPNEHVTSVAFRPGTNQVVSSSGKIVRIWDISTQEEVMTFEGHTRPIRSVAVTPDGKRIVSAGADSVIKVWDADDIKEHETLRGHTGTIHTVSISQDGTRLVSAGVDDKMIKVWNLNRGVEIQTYRSDQWLNCAAFSPDGELIVSGGSKGGIKMWATSMKQLNPSLEVLRGNVNLMAFSPDGNSIVSCNEGGGIKLWDVDSCAETSTWGEFMSNSVSVAFHPNGRELAAGKEDGRIVFWDIVRKSKIKTISGHEDKVTCLAFSNDGQKLVTGSSDTKVKLWNPISGSCELTFEKHKYPLQVVAFSPDDKLIMSGGEDYAVRVWDPNNGAELTVFKGHKQGHVISGTFSPDGRRVVSGSKNGPIIVWDVQTGAELVVSEEKNPSLRAMAGSPDGKRIAYINKEGNTVVVLDTVTGMQALTIPLPGKNAKKLIFSPNGRTIALSSDKGILMLESEAPAAKYKLRRDAKKGREWVEHLFSKHASYAEVAELLETDDTVTNAVREKALQISHSRVWEECDKAVEDSYETSRIIDNDNISFQRALQQAELANNSQPDDPFGLLVLGMAQYRVGAYDEACKSLLRAKKIWMSSHRIIHPLMPVFISMAHYQVGQINEGRAGINTFRDSLEDARFADIKSGKFSKWIEAERVFAGGNHELLVIWEAINRQEFDRAIDMFSEIQPSLHKANSDYTYSLDGLSRFLSRACYARGKSRIAGEYPDYAKKISDYEAAIQVDPNYISVLRDLAWLRVTCEDDEIRDPQKAVEEANRVCKLTHWENHECLSVLAAAYSETNQTTEAVKWQQRAIALLSQDGQAEWGGNYRERLGLYQSSMPYSAGPLWNFTQGKLIALWDFNDVEDRVVKNRIVDGSQGTLDDGSQIVCDAERGNVLNLHKSRVHCSQEPAFDITAAISYGAWIKLRPSMEGWHVVFSKGNRGWAMSAHPGGLATMSINILNHEKYQLGIVKDPLKYHAISVNTNLQDGGWHHVFGTYDGERACVYVDGDLGRSETIQGYIATNNSPFVIGDNPEWSEQHGYDWSWNGFVDDVCVYSYALTADEVKDLYEGREPPREKNLDP